MTEGQKRKRLTAAQKEERKKYEERHEQTKEFLTGLAIRSNKIRSKEKEFHGLERELLDLQKELLANYEKSKDIKHPRDVGAAREVLIRAFFIETKLLPKKYAVSEVSVRVASTSGHLSNELDLLFYNADDCFSLMQRQHVYEVLPVEYTYGAIQVKSKLTKTELKKAFANIASYKKLKRMVPTSVSYMGTRRPEFNGFGIIFAYDTDLAWDELAEELKALGSSGDVKHLPNAVFILSKGWFLFGDEQSAKYYNSDMQKIQETLIYGNPDTSGHCLYQLYSLVFDFCADTISYQARPHHYARLPLTAGEHSYRYNIGGFAEMGVCDEHGDYARSYTPEKLERVITWCQTAEPINWIKATELAYGHDGTNTEAYARQPGDIRIYNPESLPLTQVLVRDANSYYEGRLISTKALAFDVIESSGLNMCIPYYYQVKEELVQTCPQCDKKLKKTKSQKTIT
ncbi:DUF6602 domain-containing protein [Pseudomonas lijiangensis]|uniref:DUF6602 domain-containing protein n=1 Tax=Pseudomonas lijiangensis TaxID=2995658 RepID=A0ABX8HTG5_9PSED|nr:DUF6602 domain-containing protein [Pseudomonas lijiangensis]MBX8500899.1 hypothetical protein [Pseudomonas lijiangensis]MBX8505792.1 hypothetical protein [Pseudomonas lijiangensis]QWU83774.1 hypothetical protein KQP88_02945 [Pseudomonas lijiangensis]